MSHFICMTNDNLSNYTKVEGHINTWIKYYLMSIYCYMSQVLDLLIYLSVFILLIQYFVNFFPLSKYLFCLTGKRTDTTPRNFIKERKNTLYLLCLFYSDNEIITVCGRPAICSFIGWFKTSRLFISLFGFCGSKQRFES